MIAIIVILAAILFPVFAAAREKARSVTCLNNMSQLGRAMMIYTGDFNERFPAVGEYWHVKWNRWRPDWIEPCDRCPSVGYPKTGSLWGYTKNEAIYTCPSNAKRVISLTMVNKPFFDGSKVKVTYTMNYFLQEKSDSTPRGITLAKITFAADTFLLYDESVLTVNDGCYHALSIDINGDQHANGANALNTDGHAQRYPYFAIGNGPNRGPLWCHYKPDRKQIDEPPQGDCP